jgi:hypothetical protein
MVTDPRSPNGLIDRGLLVGVAVYAIVLLIQNGAILSVAGHELRAAQADGYLAGEIKSLVLFASVKIVLLVAAVGGAIFAKTSLRFIVCAAAILYAFPLGVLIESALTGRTHGEGAAILLSVSAATSYASAAALVVLWRRARSRERASR